MLLLVWSSVSCSGADNRNLLFSGKNPFGKKYVVIEPSKQTLIYHVCSGDKPISSIDSYYIENKKQKIDGIQFSIIRQEINNLFTIGADTGTLSVNANRLEELTIDEVRPYAVTVKVEKPGFFSDEEEIEVEISNIRSYVEPRYPDQVPNLDTNIPENDAGFFTDIDMFVKDNIDIYQDCRKLDDFTGYTLSYRFLDTASHPFRITTPPITTPPITTPPITNPPITNPPMTAPPMANKPGLSLATALDYEKLSTYVPTLSITVQQPSPSSKTLTPTTLKMGINVEDQPNVVITDPLETELSFDNCSPQLQIIQASDPNEDTTGITYMLSSQKDNDTEIDVTFFGIDASTGDLSIISNDDVRDGQGMQVAKYALVVNVSKTPFEATEKTYTITLNRNPHVASPPQTAIVATDTWDELTTAGASAIIDLSKDETDILNNIQVSIDCTTQTQINKADYNISYNSIDDIMDANGSVITSPSFNITPAGEISLVAGTLDFETSAFYTLSINATITTPPIMTAQIMGRVITLDVTIPIRININDLPYLSFVQPTQTQEITFDTCGVAINNDIDAQYSPTDTTSTGIMYSIIGQNDHFEIDPLTGVLSINSVAQRKNYEVLQGVQGNSEITYQLNIQVSKPPQYDTTEKTYPVKFIVPQHHLIVDSSNSLATPLTFPGELREEGVAELLELPKNDVLMLLSVDEGCGSRPRQGINDYSFSYTPSRVMSIANPNASSPSSIDTSYFQIKYGGPIGSSNTIQIITRKPLNYENSTQHSINTIIQGAHRITNQQITSGTLYLQVNVEDLQLGNFSDPFLVATGAELRSIATGFRNDWMMRTSRAALTAPASLTYLYAITNDITLSSTAFTPIGNCGLDNLCDTLDDQVFSGIITSERGEQNTIKGLKVTLNGTEDASGGLIGVLSGLIANIIIENPIIRVIRTGTTAKAYAGAVSGIFQSDIDTPMTVLPTAPKTPGVDNVEVRNAHVIAVGNAQTYAGGMVGYVKNVTGYTGNQNPSKRFINSSTISDVTATSVSKDAHAGGIIGFVNAMMDTVVTSVVSSGTVQAWAPTGKNAYSGGIVGFGEAGLVISDALAQSAVYASGGGTTISGSLIGNNAGTLQTSLAIGQIFTPSGRGALAGINTGTITNSHWDLVQVGTATKVGSNFGELSGVERRNTNQLTCPSAPGTNCNRKSTYQTWTNTWAYRTASEYPVPVMGIAAIQRNLRQAPGLLHFSNIESLNQADGANFYSYNILDTATYITVTGISELGTTTVAITPMGASGVTYSNGNLLGIGSLAVGTTFTLKAIFQLDTNISYTRIYRFIK